MHAEIQYLGIVNKIKMTIQLFVQVTRSHAIWQLVHFWRGKKVHSFHRASHDFSSMYFATILEEKKNVILPQKTTWGEILN